MHPVFYPPAPTLSGAPGIPSSLQPLGTLWDTRASDGSRLSREPRGGLACPTWGSCTGSLLGADGVGQRYDGGGVWGMYTPIVWVGIVWGCEGDGVGGWYGGDAMGDDDVGGWCGGGE